MKVAVISDLHANIYAFNAVLNDLDKEKVSTVLVVGDIIGYYYWPADVVNILMQDERFVCIRGNHEDILQDVLSSRESADFYRKKYGSGYDFCQEQLSETQINWLTSLPREKNITLDGVTFYISHGSLGRSDEYLYPDVSLDKLITNYSDARYTFYGHTHYPFIHEYGGKCLANPGSIGQPRDEGGLASYLILNTENNVIRFKRKSFDTAAVIMKAKKIDPALEYLAAIFDR